MVRIKDLKRGACALELTVRTKGKQLQTTNAQPWGPHSYRYRKSFFSHPYPCPLLPFISSPIVLSEGASYVFCTGLLECTFSQCHIKIPTTQCLWTQMNISLFTKWFDPSLTAHHIKILPQIRDKRAPDPCAVLTGVICASSRKRDGKRDREREGERKRGGKRGGDDEAGILKYMVTLHEFFICQQLFL